MYESLFSHTRTVRGIDEPPPVYRIKWTIPASLPLEGTFDVSLDLPNHPEVVKEVVRGLRAIGRTVTVSIPERQVEVETPVDVETL